MGKSEGNSEDWLVTYSDMVTLLLTFFVLLYTLSPGVDQETFDSFVSYFQATSGIMDNDNPQSRKPSKTQGTYDQENLQQWSQFKDYLEQNGLSSEVSIKLEKQGIQVTLSDSLTFNSGSAELLPLARQVLGKMAGIFDKKIKNVEVQGHTDNVPIAPTSRYRSNWHLGAARAVSVVLFIQQASGLDPARFMATSFGEYRPVANNNTTAGRRRNRRVEIYIGYEQPKPTPPGQVNPQWKADVAAAGATGDWNE